VSSFDKALLRQPSTKRVLLQQRGVVSLVHEANRLPLVGTDTNGRSRLFRLGERVKGDLATRRSRGNGGGTEVFNVGTELVGMSGPSIDRDSTNRHGQCLLAFGEYQQNLSL